MVLVLSMSRITREPSASQTLSKRGSDREWGWDGHGDWVCCGGMESVRRAGSAARVPLADSMSVRSVRSTQVREVQNIILVVVVSSILVDN